jgi:nucleoside-diphosphate-sugar epimerase
VFDADALTRVVKAAAPQVIIHQRTDLPFAPGMSQYEGASAHDGTRNLVAAAKNSGVRRLIAQSIAFIYAPGAGARTETDPLDLGATGARKHTVDGVVTLEQASLGSMGFCMGQAHGSTTRRVQNPRCMLMQRLMLPFWL